MLLQETHSTKENEIRRNDDFNGQKHYFHGKSNSRGVLIAFFGSIMYTVGKKASYKHGRISIIEALIDDNEFILFNLYNANSENDQVTTFSELTNLSENFDLTKNKSIIFAGDFNLVLDRSLETKGGNPCLKNQFLSKLFHIKEKLNLCDIWQIRNPKVKQYTFRQQHFFDFNQRPLDYIFISQNLQEIARHTEILKAISTDHSPVLCSFQNHNQCQRRPGLWKFNNFLVSNEKYV